MSLEAVRVKEEPGSALKDPACIKKETEWSEEAECAEQELPWVKWKPGEHWLMSDQASTLACVKAEPSRAEPHAAPAPGAGAGGVQRSADSVRHEWGSSAVPASARAEPARVLRGGQRAARRRGHGESVTEGEPYAADYDKDPICDLCGRRFALKSELVEHVAVHIDAPSAEQEGGSDAIADAELPGTLWRWARLVPRECRVRLERVDAGHPYTCDMCRRTFPLKRSLTSHIREHMEKYQSYNISKVIHKRKPTINKIYSCECEKQFKVLRDLLTHIQNNSNDKPYSCDMCKKRFVTESGLKKHRSVHKKAYSCDVCKQKFTYLHMLRKHKISVHKVIYVGKVGHFCEICNHRFKCRSILEMHRRVHTGEKPYPCELCKKRFTQMTDLNAHRRIHTGEKPYPCEMCKKRFRKVSDLYRHKRVHTGEKPHSCDICGKKFRRLYCLAGHVRVHAGEKPYGFVSKLRKLPSSTLAHCAGRGRGRPRKRTDCATDDVDGSGAGDERTCDRDVDRDSADPNVGG